MKERPHIDDLCACPDWLGNFVDNDTLEGSFGHARQELYYSYWNNKSDDIPADMLNRFDPKRVEEMVVYIQLLTVCLTSSEVLIVRLLKLHFEVLDFLVLLLKDRCRVLRRLCRALSLLLNLTLQEGNFLLRLRKESLLVFRRCLERLMDFMVQRCLQGLRRLSAKGGFTLQGLMELSAHLGSSPPT